MFQLLAPPQKNRVHDFGELSTIHNGRFIECLFFWDDKNAGDADHIHAVMSFEGATALAKTLNEGTRDDALRFFNRQD